LDFPYIPKAYVRRTLLKNNSFYAPAHLVLAEELTREVLPYVKKTQATRVTGKGKARQSVEFEAERQWILRGGRDADEDTVQGQGTTQAAEDADEEEDEECEDGIQCGCCFSSYAFVSLFQCDIDG
jgi:E3 ubiquitin-protein ligase RNF216